MKKAMILILCSLAMTTILSCEKKPVTLDEAIALSEKTGKPVLIDFFADWCSPCKAFAREMIQEAQIKKALDNVILFTIDIKKGVGVDQAAKYKIKAYPTFVMVNDKEQVIDRWIGYEKNYFLETLEMALSNLSPVEEKTERFARSPNFEDAVALGRYNYASDKYKTAVDYYMQAQELSDDKSRDFSFEIFEIHARGNRYDIFTYDEVTSAAETVLESGNIENTIDASMIMNRIARSNEKFDDMEKFLKIGLDSSADSDDSQIKRSHNLMQVDYNLYFAKDVDKAVKFKKASMKEGWVEDASGLNSFAWWCYENLVNLEEAEALARHAVELSEPGNSRAMILDTHAHILKALGKLDEAIEIMELAVTEAPDDEQYSKALKSFKDEIAEK